MKLQCLCVYVVVPEAKTPKGIGIYHRRLAKGLNNVRED